MTQTEERLRDAYRAVVQAVRPEDIPDRPQPRAYRHVRTAAPRWAGLLVPIGAAAAVVALVVGATVLVPKLTAGTTSPQRAYAPTPTRSLPEFSVVNDGGSLRVTETLTGRVTGTVQAPPGQNFTGAAGAADDKTFLVAADLSAQNNCQTFLYKLSLSGTGQPSALSPVRSAAPPAGLPTALAMTADGSTAALSEVSCATGPPATISDNQPIGAIYLIEVGTGQVTRSWSYTLGMDYPSDMSLSADGSRLTFSTYLNAKEMAGWVLPANAPSGTVATAGRVAVRQPAGLYAGIDTTVISADGRTLYACTHSGDTPSRLSATISAYDASDGRLERVLHTWTGGTGLSCDAAASPAHGQLLVLKNQSVLAKSTPATKKRLTVTVSVWTVSTSTGAVSALPIHVPGPAVSGSIAW